jgi:hypothetical protein
LTVRPAWRRACLLTKENGLNMSTRKKNAALARHGKPRHAWGAEKHTPCGPPRLSPDIEAMLMVGDEHVVISQEVDENIGFMAEFIDPI